MSWQIIIAQDMEVYLIFPILFSVIVFYPIWSIATTNPRGFFVFYAAFLNGYFWENVVSSIKAPPGASGSELQSFFYDKVDDCGGYMALAMSAIGT
jgi:hypothetical protein